MRNTDALCGRRGPTCAPKRQHSTPAPTRLLTTSPGGSHSLHQAVRMLRSCRHVGASALRVGRALSRAIPGSGGESFEAGHVLITEQEQVRRRKCRA